MTKSELIARLALRFPQLVAKDADLAVKMILDAMSDTLAKGDRIEIRGFGSFSLNYRPPRVGRNPKSGVKVEVPANATPRATPGRSSVAIGRGTVGFAMSTTARPPSEAATYATEVVEWMTSTKQTASHPS